jgi:putative hydrolase
MMSPFGFTPDDGSEENPNEMTPEQLAAMLAQMQEQVTEQFQKLGINPAGFINPFSAGTESLPKSIVRDTAKKIIATSGSLPVGNTDLTVVAQASSIAQLWLNEATDFAPIASATRTLSRSDWIDSTLAGWQVTVEPLATGLAAAVSELMQQAINEGETGETPMPIETIATLLRSFISALIATQLGHSVGALASSVTGIHDVGLPLVDPAVPALVPENIALWSQDLEIPKSEITLFHAIREEAVARLFDSNPWLVSYIRTAISEYGKGIHIDIDAIQRQAQEAMESGNIDPNNPESFTLAIGEGMFTPDESPAQRAALTKLETVFALIEGWTDEVTTLAVSDRLPSIGALRETFRRRRATSAPTQQLFKSLFGLEVSPRMSREAANFWKVVREQDGVSARDKIWSSLLPTPEDLLNPQNFLKSTEVPDDLSGL